MPTIGYSYTTDNEELPVKDGASTNPNTRGFISVGVDAGGVARFVRTDASGRIEIAGGGGVLGIVDQGSPAAVADAWPIKVTDGVDTAAIAPASTAALASDPSLVVQVSPNQTAIPVSVSGSVTANQGTAAATASAWPIKLTDGTDTAAILPGSTVPLAGDAALVVSLSPNLAVGTLANPFRVDPTGTTTQPVSDAGGSLTVDGTVTSKLADENGDYFTSSLKNNTRSLAVESRDLVLLLGQILGELRVMRAQLASITDEDDPL